jgi:hypothetical protein
VANLLWKEGALVKGSETKTIKNDDQTYVGYCDIFNTKDFDIYIKTDDNKYRDATKTELANVIKHRKEKKLTGTYGLIFPTQPAKQPNSPYVNAFKITTGIGKGSVCNFKKVPELIEILRYLNPSSERLSDKSNRDVLCSTIAYEMIKNDKLLLMPVYKP